MDNSTIIESQYPIQFHFEEARKLGECLKHRRNVMLIGMKRVGISNFLRFFLYHKDIASTYINDGKKHLFIPVDLNDLVERKIFPFWILTLKRIVDVVEVSSASSKLKKHIEFLFLEAIQSNNLFLVKEYLRKSLGELVANGFIPTIFFIRFDRLQDVVTPELFNNLQSLHDSTQNAVCFVFTSFHSLNRLSPTVFNKVSMPIFLQNMYIKPVSKQDIEIIADKYKKTYKINLSHNLENLLYAITDGYVQYLQLALILLQEQKIIPTERSKIFQLLISDERINLQSEELWESLNDKEQKILIKIVKKQAFTNEDKENGRYLFDTGFIKQEKGEYILFSEIFQYFVKERKGILAKVKEKIELSKKENKLFQLLLANLNAICEREDIIMTVWPEEEAIGVSDWAIDRLVSRIRFKLKQQQSSYRIQTIRTRGHKLVEG